MLDAIVSYEAPLRFGVFIMVLSVMVMWELLGPGRALISGRGRRWVTNLLMLVAGTLALRFLMPLLAVGAAVWAEKNDYGLLNLLDLPLWLSVIAGLLILDLAIYAQHVATHHIPVLWRIHRVHHADRDVDVTTALRFHPIELVFSMAYKVVLVAGLGIAPGVVILFEILLNGCALFNHGNVRLPRLFEPVVRAVIVTPDMHRIHHSVRSEETNRNFGFCLSLWDRLFGTYVKEPAAGQTGMAIGLDGTQGDEPDRLWWSLGLPFRALNGRKGSSGGG